MIKIISILALTLISSSWSKPTTDNTTPEFQTQALNVHNYYRSCHNTPALVIDQSLVTYAKQRCALISQYDKLSNGHNGLRAGTGENIYWGWHSPGQTPDTATAAIRSWYNEIKDYNYSSPGFSSKTGHFTQLVWKSTTKVGCARCSGDYQGGYETYVVCDYEPQGNIVNDGYFKANVLAQSKTPDDNVINKF